MTTSFTGKVIAITGGARGIGLATAKRLLAAGADVAIGDIDEPALQRAASTLGITTFRKLDVTSPTSFAAFVDHVERELGPLDVLVNNAGIMPVGPIDTEDDAVTRRLVEINVLGVIYGTKLALRSMLPRNTGHVINIASLAGENHVPGAATYCATKHAVAAFTESVRRELRGTSVQLSSVRPTFVNTELVAGAKPMKLLRNAEPEEIADAIASLIAKPRPVVRVTRMAGLVSQSQRYLPAFLVERIARALGVDSMLLGDVDRAARSAYDARARAS